MIRAVELGKRYGPHQVLRGISLGIDAGQRVALLGLNGAGKTTLIRCLLGLTPFDGQLEIAGLDVRLQGRDARARLGYVPQRAPHFDGSLGEVVAFFARLRGVDVAAVAQRMEALGLSLPEHAGKPVRNLSGGMLQKVLLALALGSEVPLLLLDEPTANLDSSARREFLRALRSVDPQTTILLASHRFTDVEAIADRLLVLHRGTLVLDGQLSDLRRRLEEATTLWLQVRPEHRDQARGLLVRQFSLDPVRTNGASLGVQAPPRIRAEAIASLHLAGIPVENCWTEPATLAELLGEVLNGVPDGNGTSVP